MAKKMARSKAKKTKSVKKTTPAKRLKSMNDEFSIPLPKAGPPSDELAERRQKKFRVLVDDLMKANLDFSNIPVSASAPLVLRIHAELAKNDLVPRWTNSLPPVDLKAAELALSEVNDVILEGTGITFTLEELVALGLLMRGDVFRWLAPYWSDGVNATESIKIW